MKLPSLTLPLTLATLLAGCATDSGVSRETQDAGAPGLTVGDRAPDATVYTQDGQPVSLASLYQDGPVVVTFYRGGWCPFCQRALEGWQTRLDELHDAGATLVALTPESPDHAADTTTDHHLGFAVYSDSKMQAAKAYEVFFEVDQDTQTKYKGYGIDLSSWNANSLWTLPAPGTFVIDRKGVVRYAWADWDYTKRADPDEVIGVVQGLKK
ncbi:MAG: AhpC/TSA family protein [Phycisphaerales bacterium]|nr:AhpC/TSA family protein [Phycisphaerales bacterium]